MRLGRKRRAFAQDLAPSPVVAGGGEPGRDSRTPRRGYPASGCRPRTPKKNTFAAKISYTPTGFLFFPTPECAQDARETRKSHIPGCALRVASRALRRRESSPEVNPRPGGRPKACPPSSLPGHAHRRANFPGGSSRTPAGPSGSRIHFLAPRPAPTPRPPSARGVPVGLGFRRERCGQDAGMRLTRRLPLLRALRLLGSGVSMFPIAKRGRTLSLPGRRGCSRGPGRSPEAGGVLGVGAGELPAPTAAAWGAMGGSPTHVDAPAPPPQGQLPRPRVSALRPSSAQSPPAAAAPFV